MYIEDNYDRYVVARWCYLMGEPILSDIEYDKLERWFKEEYPDDVHSKQAWSFDDCPSELLTKYNLQSLICNPVMGYMAESIYSINNQPEFEQKFANLNEKSRLSFKIDGWNTRVSYYNGNIVKIETRGRSGNNIKMNELAKLFPSKIDIKGRVAVTGEMSIPHSKWQAFKALTGNSDQRASVRTAIANNSIDVLSFLAFNIFCEDATYNDAYEKLNELGFQTPRFVYVSNIKELREGIELMSFLNHGYDYLTDGLVIENAHIQNAIRLGAWEEHSMWSYVTGYEESRGMFGNYLKLKCSPIQVEGKTFSKISIANIANIIENNLRIGYPVAFNLRSSANVVIDTSETAMLQKQWAGRYDEYILKVGGNN